MLFLTILRTIPYIDRKTPSRTLIQSTFCYPSWCQVHFFFNEIHLNLFIKTIEQHRRYFFKYWFFDSMCGSLNIGSLTVFVVL